MLPHTTVLFQFHTHEVALAVPEQEALKQWHEQNKATHVFPYWGKVWPASKALSQFIAAHKELIQHKKVMEIASGLGLPSLVAALFAKEVICTDAVKEALEFVNKSIQLNAGNNISTGVYNWNEDATTISAELLLMSDVNYNPDDFPQLLAFVKKQVQTGKTILLSTPQRLMAKPFIESLQPFITQHEEYFTDEVMCSVFVLTKQF